MTTKLLLSLAIRFLLLDLGMVVFLPGNPDFVLLGQGVGICTSTRQMSDVSTFNTSLYPAIVSSMPKSATTVALALRSLFCINVVAMRRHVSVAPTITTHAILI